jgi:hypothetical protein
MAVTGAPSSLPILVALPILCDTDAIDARIAMLPQESLTEIIELRDEFRRDIFDNRTDEKQ